MGSVRRKPADSGPGCGAAETNSIAVQLVERNRSSREGPASEGVATVLLIEDSPADARLIEELLKDAPREEIELHVATTLSEGEAILEQGRPDVVLLDLFLPDSRGLDTCRSIHRRFPGLPVVVLTGFAQEGTGLEALRQGAQDYLVKNDLDGASLHRVLRHAMERARISGERDRALRAREESEERYRGLYDDTPAMLFTLDRAARIRQVNRYGADYLGYEVGQLAGRSFVEALAEGSGSIMEALEACLETEGEPSQYKWVVRHADGRRLWLRATLRSLGGDGDDRQVLAVCDDVTGAELQESFLGAVLDNIRDGIVACDAEGRLTLFNPATQEFHGVPYDAVEPDEWADRYDLYHADGVTKLAVEEIPLYRAFTGEKVRDAEMVIAPAQGKRRTLVASGQAMYDAEGRKLGAVVSMHDVTESRRVAEQLQQAQKMEAIGQLTGGLAHDFNNILAVVIGNLQLLERVCPVELPDVRRQLDAAQDAALRGGKLTRQLLAFARKQALAPKVVDAGELVSGMEQIIARALSGNVDVRVEVADDLWKVKVDASLLESALLNLAINARDAMPDGGTLSISLGNTRLEEDYAALNPDVESGPFVLISVADTGTGMSREVMERVLEPFFTTKEAGRGSGLGLSMVYGFARQSGGHLKLYSEPGSGTVVRLYLPRATGAPEDDEVEDDAAALPVGDESILIVEDDPSLRQVTRSLLEDLGYRTVTAASGPEALERLARESTIDLVFTDMVMPGGMNGMELAREVQALYPEVRILFTSGFTETHVFDDPDFADGLALLSKPYQQRELAVEIRRALDDD